MTRSLQKSLLFLLCLLPLGLLLAEGFGDQLGANPVEVVTHRTGEWALKFLLLTLAITPLKRFTGWSRLVRFRRMLGLFAFFYALLHVSTWLVLDHWFYLPDMFEDIVKRPYVTIGMATFILLIPLAATSTRGMQLRLGRRWKVLHQLVYPAAVLAVVHWLWLTKADYLEPAVYGALLALLLGVRLPLFKPAV